MADIELATWDSRHATNLESSSNLNAQAGNHATVASDTPNDTMATISGQARRLQSAIPPPDEGYYAWVSLAGSFFSNGLIWGLAFSVGILQNWYASHEPFASHPGGIAAIGTTCTGLMYLTMPMFLWAFQRWPRMRRYSMWAGVPTVSVALVGASFANTVPQLLVCQGVIYAIAGNALVMPTLNYLNEWFVRRRGLAIGVAIAGDGVGGVLMPLLLQALLSHVGFRWTLRIVAGIIVVLSAPILMFIKPRLPVSATHVAPPMDLAFLRTSLFWTLQLFNIIQALGYFLPVNYLPSIAESLGFSATLGSLTVLLINLGMVGGCIATGLLVDRFDVTAVLFMLGLLSSIAVWGILGNTTNIGLLYAFSLMYGLTASAYSTSWGGIIKNLQKEHEGTDANLVFGLLAAGRGVGSIISGPLSEALLAGDAVWKGTATAYSGDYRGFVIFSGCTALVGGFSWLVRRAGLI